MAQPLPSPAGPRRPATLADWEGVPAPYTAHLVDGVLYAMGRPIGPHSEALGGVYASLREPFHRGSGGPGGWLLLQEVDVRLGDNVVSPDIAGWRRGRLPTTPRVTPIPLAPDWVCEVLSPSTETFDRGVKSLWYASVGVGWLWFVDPEDKLLEAFRNDAGAWRPVGTWRGDSAVAAPPFESAPWPLVGLWG